MAISIELKGTKALRTALRRAGKRAEKALASGLYQEAGKVMATSKKEAPVGVDGTLRASGFVKLPKSTPRGVEVELGYGGAAAGYAVFVHEGTGPAVGRPPYSPPPEAFRDWARKKLGDESLAFVVARSVGRKGTKPTKFLERPLRASVRGMASRLAQHVRTHTGG